MTCNKCGCEDDDDDIDEDADDVSEDLDESDLEEAMSLMKKLDMKKIFIKDLFVMRDKLNGILKDQEQDSDYDDE